MQRESRKAGFVQLEEGKARETPELLCTAMLCVGIVMIKPGASQRCTKKGS